MATTTIKEFAEKIGRTPERLLAQLADAGIKADSADHALSEDEKMKLLEFLQSSHGRTGGKLGAVEPKKVTLKRRTTSELKTAGPQGRARTVNVEVRKKRTYVKRSVVQEAEEAKRAEEEAKLAAIEAEKKAAADAEAAKLAEEKNRAEEAKRAEEEAREAERRAEEERKAAELQARQDELKRAAEAAEAEKAKAQPKPEPVPDRAAVEAEVAKKEAPGRKAPAKAAPGRRDADKRRHGGKPMDGQLHVAAGKGGRRKKRGGRRQPAQANVENAHTFEKPTAPVIREVELTETITVAELAKRMAVKGTDVVAQMMKMGAMVTINQTIDQDTAALVVEEMGHKYVIAKEDDAEADILDSLRTEDDGEGETRSPVVTVMGHVDHGKTSLLDHIRKAKVADGEAGGITQHIGAYHVDTDKGGITFLDTPGHAAFTAMRARGAKATDIVILVVAADDGVMPQTEEAVQHAKAAEVPLIVAVNKSDKPEADPEKVRSGLAALEVIPEDWGGEHQFVNVSAHTGQGIDELLDAIGLQAEVLELKASADRAAAGVVIESSLEKGRGAVATVLVQTGTLKRGDMLLCGTEYGRVRAMVDDKGQQVNQAGPSTPVAVLGLSGVPDAGDEALVLEDERKAREVADLRADKAREAKLARQQAARLQNLFDQMAEGKLGTVNLLVKADVQGSYQALSDAFTGLSNEEVKVKLVGGGVGGINESDVNLAMASEALIVGFNVRADATARKLMQDEEVEPHYYSVIYEAIDTVKQLISGMLAPEIKETIIGLAEVRDVFEGSGFGKVAGCLVVDGTVKRNAPIRVLRENVVIYEGELESLRRFKDNVNEVQAGTECGIAVKNYEDVRPGDQIEVYERTEVARQL